MTHQPLNGVVKQVRKLAAIQSARLAPDADLLEQFVRTGDEAVLTVLIERHAPMVLGVCRRALCCPFDAEDACQATFLVFSRQAGAIRKTASLASWLHSVALRVAAKLKRERARRARRERGSLPSPPRSPADEVSWAEVKTLLDEELQSLPERYRAVLILCYLDGKTRDEAARQLGVSLGALHGLLERGRKLLADRLTRRGLTLSAGLLGIAVGDGCSAAGLSATQILTTAQAATLFAAGQAPAPFVSAGVLTLANQILKGMIMTKLKLASACLLGFVLVVSFMGYTFAQSRPEPQKDNAAAKVTEARQKAVQALTTLGSKDTDEAFIRRVSKDLRGIDPSPAEVHFFVTSKETKKREKLVDLFIAEREAKKKAQKDGTAEAYAELLRVYYAQQAQLQYGQKKPEDARTPHEPHDLAPLKTNVALAKLAVREKELLLRAAQERSDMGAGSKTQVELASLELARARLLLEQAEHALAAAEKKSPKGLSQNGLP